MLLAPDGTWGNWVVPDENSICVHQSAIATNLSLGALSLLAMLDRLGVSFGERALPRPAWHRAARAGRKIGWVPLELPDLSAVLTDRDRPAAEEDGQDEEGAHACPVAATHARLDQAHTLWHEALDAYQEPELFTTKLNALLTSLRSVTFVLQKELARTSGFDEWYEQWRLEEGQTPPFLRPILKAWAEWPT